MEKTGLVEIQLDLVELMEEISRMGGTDGVSETDESGGISAELPSGISGKKQES